jgi:hypothetical protein
MQYGEFAFSKNSQRTIIPKNGKLITDPYDKKGSAILTPSDVSGIKQQYQCPLVSNFPFYTFILRNNQRFRVSVFWIDIQGVERLWFQLNPGASSHSQDSYRTHEWVVKGTNFVRRFKIGEGKFTAQNTNINISNL